MFGGSLSGAHAKKICKVSTNVYLIHNYIERRSGVDNFIDNRDRENIAK